MRNRLRELRARDGLTQADLANALDVSRQTVNALESGKYDPSLPLAFRISRTFRLRLDEIFFPDAT
jgi:putative transcriptional regulator